MQASSGDLAGALGAGNGDGLLDLGEGGHPSRDDQRFPRPCGGRDQPDVDEFERGDLVGRDADRLEEVHRRFVEDRAEELDPAVGGLLGEVDLPFPRHRRFGVEIVERAPLPQSRGPEVGRIAVERDRVGGVGLHLDRVGSRVGRRVEHRERPLSAAVVIAGELGDAEHRGVASHLAVTEHEARDGAVVLCGGGHRDRGYFPPRARPPPWTFPIVE